MKSRHDLYEKKIIEHYTTIFGEHYSLCQLPGFSGEKLHHEFGIVEFPPAGETGMWTYATFGMSRPLDEEKIELYMHSSVKDESIAELLVAAAFYHQTMNRLGLNHTVFFGRPWQKKSKCEYGFVSLPYLFGPDLENSTTENGLISFYWLLPVTESEVEYKKSNGVDALESLFDKTSLNYLDPDRENAV